MHVSPKQKTTNLRTATTFEVVDMQGQFGFPKGQGGLVFDHHEKRNITDKFTGLFIKRDARYVVRTDDTDKGWRIDQIRAWLPTEAVYGLDRATHWDTNHEAAAALQGRLDEIRDNSSVGTL